MFGIAEWAIVILLALIVFGATRAPVPRRQTVRVLEDMRPPAPPVSKTRPGIEFDLLIAAGLVIAALSCVIVLLLSQSSWV
jgi:hypothetical protein